MSERDEEFWEVLEDWSRRKHLILKNYLLPATAKLRSASWDGRVVIVDAFAGRGQYEDGTPGSPLHMCELAEQSRRWQNPVRLEIYNTEPNPDNFGELRRVTAAWEQQQVVFNLLGTFQQHLPFILQRASRSSMVAFLDPFRPSHLLFEDFNPLLNRESPTDVMIVFMTPAIQRVIRAAAPHANTAPQIKESHVRFLDGVFGGNGWHHLLLKNPLDPKSVVECFMDSLLERSAHGRRKYICCSAVSRGYKKELKYHVVLFTRHLDGALLINDAFCKEQRELYASHVKQQPTLDLGANSDTPNIELSEPERIERLTSSLLQIGRKKPEYRWKRGQLIDENLLLNFGEYLRSEHRGAVEALAAREQWPRIISPRYKNGRPKMNDETEIWFEF